MNKKRVGLLLGLMLLVCMLTGCCDHQWSEPTCTEPATCSECGETKGDVKHTYEPVGCEESTVCSECGATIEAVGHTWVDATCKVSKTCSVCNATEGESLGHSTRYGECSVCGEDINDIELKDGFAVVTFSDTSWMQEKDDFVDVYVAGTIADISQYNDVVIVDAENQKWTVDVGTGCDLTGYVGTACEVYGFSTGGISSTHETPLINMSHDNNRISFSDGKTLYPNNYDSEQQFNNKYSNNSNSSSSSGTTTTTPTQPSGAGNVWIPQSGSKYHSKSSCSNMNNPSQVSESKAISMGYSRCKRCW